MTRINTQGNTPPAEKRIDRSDRYWKERADQEDQLNRGAPDLSDSQIDKLHQPIAQKVLNPVDSNDSFFKDLLRSLEKMKPDMYILHKQEEYGLFNTTVDKIYNCRSQNGELTVSISRNGANIFTKKGNDSVLVSIKYKPDKSEITMNLLSDTETLKTLKLEDNSNFKAILDRALSPTE